MTRALITSIETYCGHYLDYENPLPEHIELADIARGLAQTCRFAGQTTRFYSVAEHAVYVSRLVTEWGHDDLALAALHHDDHEAYVCDWPSPLKHVLGGVAFDEVCSDIDDAVAEKFGFDFHQLHSDPVKHADRVALRHEAATLKFSHGVGPHWDFYESFVPLAGVGWMPDKAEREFLKAHARLTA